MKNVKVTLEISADEITTTCEHQGKQYIVRTKRSESGFETDEFDSFTDLWGLDLPLDDMVDSACDISDLLLENDETGGN